MKRITYKTVEYDYNALDEFYKHAEIMNKKGWSITQQYDIHDGQYIYHAQYTTGVLFNGINAK